MPTILITGANRGVGLDFARAYAADGWHVIAANRTPLSDEDVATLGRAVEEIPYDALDDASAAALAERLQGQPIDVLLCAAQRRGGQQMQPFAAMPAAVTPADWWPIMLTNAYAPLRLASLLEPNLRAGTRKVLAALSRHASTLGTEGRSSDFTYRASQAALNQLFRTLSVEWRDWGCTALLLCPDSIEPPRSAMLASPPGPRAVAGLRALIAAVSQEQSGQHWTPDGRVLPW
ncbi:SDR family NAD(P)-dependent oxidoreductase [Rhizobium sp. YIM 134829]|uniref:SDR family NAD(P)-dependent oxidoreductase n=1 Tax=Rhizobium sp. YIM 134829 TaxID=3390453 RepID=UPI0039781D17